MYQAPDFAVVSTNVKDVFAAYNLDCTYAEYVTLMVGECVAQGGSYETYLEVFPDMVYLCETTLDIT